MWISSPFWWWLSSIESTVPPCVLHWQYFQRCSHSCYSTAYMVLLWSWIDLCQLSKGIWKTCYKKILLDKNNINQWPPAPLLLLLLLHLSQLIYANKVSSTSLSCSGLLSAAVSNKISPSWNSFSFCWHKRVKTPPVTVCSLQLLESFSFWMVAARHIRLHGYWR